jgi:hypothetical protein
VFESAMLAKFPGFDIEYFTASWKKVVLQKFRCSLTSRDVAFQAELRHKQRNKAHEITNASTTDVL